MIVRSFKLSITNIFRTSSLFELAQGLVPTTKDVTHSIQPYSLAQKKLAFERSPRSELELAELRERAAAICQLQPNQISDILPATHMQQGLLAMTSQHEGDYVRRDIMRLGDEVLVDAFKAAWETVIANNPILHTRVVQIPRRGMFQVTTTSPVDWTFSDDLQMYLRQDDNQTIDMGQPLLRLALVPDQNAGHGRYYFIRTIHHSLFDLHTLNLVDQQISQVYHGLKPVRTLPFSVFVKYTMDVQSEISEAFWTNEMDGFNTIPFPLLPSPAYKPRATSNISRAIASLDWQLSRYTPTTFLRAIWGLLLSGYSGSSDVVFGVTVSGRQAPINGIEVVVGPTISTIPLRVNLSDFQGCKASDLLASLQWRATNMISYEQLGLQSIRRLSEGTQAACEFQNLLILQPKDLEIGNAARSGRPLYAPVALELQDEASLKSGSFSTYAVVLECSLGKQDIELHCDFDPQVITSNEIESLLAYFETILRHLTAHPETPIAQLVGMINNNNYHGVSNTTPKPVDHASSNGKQPRGAHIDWDENQRELVELSASILGIDIEMVDPDDDCRSF